MSTMEITRVFLTADGVIGHSLVGAIGRYGWGFLLGVALGVPFIWLLLRGDRQ